MANRFVGLDPTWAHLPTPTPTHAAASHYCSFPAAAFENKALTSALRASMAPAHAYTSAAASPFSAPATPSSSTTSSASELLSSGHDAPAPSSVPAGCPPPARALKGPKAGRVSKRKPRPSRRPQTTYITADPANFRRLVQEVTGLLPVPVPGSPSTAAPERAAAAPSWTPPPSFVLPTLDTSAFLLLDRAVPAPEGKSSSRGYAPAATGTTPAAAAAAGNDDSSALLEIEAMIDFPTLESWGII